MSTTTLSQETIQIPGAPPVPGLKFRHYRGESDLAAIVKLNNLTHTADQTGELETIDQLTHRFAHLKNCDPQKDVVLAELDGELIVYSRVSWVQQEDGITVYWHFGNIHPEWRRRGLAKALIAESIRMLRNMVFDDTALGVDTNNPNGALKLYESMGYQLDKTWMSFRKPMN